MRRESGTDTRDLILKESKRLFLEKGYNKGTFRLLGARLDVNPALVSYYFSEKKTLAKYAVIDLFGVQAAMAKKLIEENARDYSPMLSYAVDSLIHYRILAQNPEIFRFYSEFIISGGIDDIFLQIPNIRQLYSSFYTFYHLPMKYPFEYIHAVDVGLERQVMLHFEPENAFDDVFIDFVCRTVPQLVGLNGSIIDNEIEAGKTLCRGKDFKGIIF